MKRIIAIIATVIISLVVIGGVLFWLRNSSGFITSDTQDTIKTDNQQTTQLLETNYFTAVLPAGYEITSNIEKEAGLERLNITAKNNSTDTTLQIIVGDTPSGGLNGLLAYTEIVQNPNVYTNQSFSGMPTNVQTFYSNVDGYKLVAFWTYGSLYAVISLSSPTAQSSQINVTMQAFLDQWRWR